MCEDAEARVSAFDQKRLEIILYFEEKSTGRQTSVSGNSTLKVHTQSKKLRPPVFADPNGADQRPKGRYDLFQSSAPNEEKRRSRALLL